MRHHYRDIIDRISEPPAWFDEYGTPRYGAFTPDDSADIYADEVVLLEIACQSCGQRFLVCMTSSVLTSVKAQLSGYAMRSLADRVKDGSIHYGDPPNTGCCPGGATMNCEDLRVLQFWTRTHPGGRTFDWQRIPELEITLPDGQATLKTL